MNNRSVIFLLFLVLVPVGSLGSDLPDHLEPFLPAYFDQSNFDEYYATVHKSLIGEKSGLKLAMVTRLAFFSENAVVIREITVLDTLRYHRIEFAVADPMIWALMNGHAKMDSTVRWEDQIQIDRKRESLPDSLYILIRKAWRGALLQTRFSEHFNLGLDGFSYEFFLWPERTVRFNELQNLMAGHTWSPDHGVPKMLVELGSMMAEYVLCTVPERVEVSEKIGKLAREIIEEAGD